MQFRQFQMHELEISHTKGSGPGGQNRNKRMTAVRVVHLPTGITIVATERRSQSQNLQAALERLEERLETLRHVPKSRTKTRPTRSSQQKRVEQKSRRGQVKSARRRPSDSDW